MRGEYNNLSPCNSWCNSCSISGPRLQRSSICVSNMGAASNSVSTKAAKGAYRRPDM